MSTEINNQLLRHIFENNLHSYGLYHSQFNPPIKHKFLEIPLTDTTFEVPVLVLNTFFKIVEDGLDKNSIVVDLYYNGMEPRYKSVGRYMKEVLLQPISPYKLIKCSAKGKDRVYTYYGTGGAVFYEDFTPAMMCSWMLEKVFIQNTIKYNFLYPIYRINPNTFINQKDEMEKFLAKKLLNPCLTSSLYAPTIRIQQIDTYENVNNFIPSVRIENSPFKIKSVTEPTIDTSNEELRQVALRNVEEIV